MAITGTYLTKKLRYIAGKLESSAGTAETITAAEFNTRIYDPQLTLTIDMDDEAAKDASGDHGEVESVPGATYGQLSFYTKCNWGGAVGTAPSWWKFVNACGGKQKAYGAVGLALTPDQDYDIKPITLWAFDKERGGASPVTTIYKFAGCMGNCVIGADKIGGPWLARYTMFGKLQDIVDGSAIAMTALDTALPETFLSSALTINAVAALSSAWSLDFGNEVVPTYDQADATGIGYYSIASRKPRFKMNPLARKQATEDVMAVTTASTAYPISVSSTHFTLKGVDCQLTSAALGEREGYVSWDRVYKLLRNFDGTAVIDASLSVEQTWELLQGARA